VGGGTGPFTYQWEGGISTGPTATGLAAGKYGFTITDQTTTCSVTDTLEIAEPSPIGVSVIDSVNASCNNFGRIRLNAFGGNGPYLYDWADINVVDSNVVDGLLPNVSYEVKISDENGCSFTRNIMLPGPESPVSLILIDTIPPTACNTADGQITVEASGGDGNYTYTWQTNPVQTGPVATGLIVDQYLVTVVDGNGCDTLLDISLGTPCPLSAELLNFQATAKDDYIQLDWQTANEQYNSGFELQRSQDSLQFKKLAWINSKRANGDDYRFNDQEVEMNQRYYYRLKQIDISGAYTFSEIKSAIILARDLVKLLGIYPVPTQSQLFIELQLPLATNLKVQMFNTLGQALEEHTFEGNAGMNKLAIDMKHLASGLYYARIKIGGFYEIDVKLVKE